MNERTDDVLFRVHFVANRLDHTNSSAYEQFWILENHSNGHYSLFGKIKVNKIIFFGKSQHMYTPIHLNVSCFLFDSYSDSFCIRIFFSRTFYVVFYLLLIVSCVRTEIILFFFLISLLAFILLHPYFWDSSFYFGFLFGILCGYHVTQANLTSDRKYSKNSLTFVRRSALKTIKVTNLCSFFISFFCACVLAYTLSNRCVVCITTWSKRRLLFKLVWKCWNLFSMIDSPLVSVEFVQFVYLEKLFTMNKVDRNSNEKKRNVYCLCINDDGNDENV